MRETLEAALIRLYPDAGRAVDDLPYTEDFDNLCRAVRNAVRENFTHRQIWVTLMALRKTKGPNKLPTRREGQRRKRSGKGLGAFQ